MPVQLGDDDTSNVDLDKFTLMMWSGDHDTGDDGDDNNTGMMVVTTTLGR